MTSGSESSGRLRGLLLAVGIFFIAANLRAPFTGVAPVLGQIRDSFALSATAAGALTATPLLVFALVSPFVAWIASRLGLERTLFAALLLIGGGVLLRSGGAVQTLFLGTALIGVGIAIGNVLLPSLLKRNFQNRIAVLTVIYTLVMSSVAALASMLVVPLSRMATSGWRYALASLGVLAFVSALVWLPQLFRRWAGSGGTVAAPLHEGGNAKVWRSALAWQVTVFLGFNSLLYYVVIGWLPTILQEVGYSADQAGRLHGILQLSSALAGIVLMPFISTARDQRLLAVGTTFFVLLGLLGLLLVPHLGLLCSIVFGFGGGAVFVLALAFIGLRVSTPGQAAALSGMVQSFGYLLAASAPAVVGWLHDITGGWTLPLALCALLSVCMGACGFLAGRSRRIDDDSLPALRRQAG